MESSYQAALRRREKLKEELEKVEQYIVLSHELFGEPKPDWIQSETVELLPVKESAESLMAMRAPDSELRKLVDTAVRAPRTAVRPEGYAKPRDVIRAAKSILAEGGRPMTRSALLEEMERRGMVMPGVDKSKSLGTTLWRAKDDFVQIEGHGYWLKQAPNFLVGYDPRGMERRPA